MDCVETAHALSASSNDVGGEGHALNIKAAIHWTHGDLDTADALFRQARAKALEAEEHALVAMTSANLGAIANVRGDLPDALHHYSVGLSNYRSLGRLSDACHVLNNMGLLY